eukprot:COSAG05_NODE_1134_length_5765_cov_73.147017_5_plen_84_part_00
MKRYAYQVIVANQQMQCQNVQEVAQFVNTAMGFPLVSRYMVLNHFVRPHLANKRLFSSVNGQTPVIEVKRHLTTKEPSSSPEE